MKKTILFFLSVMMIMVLASVWYKSEKEKKIAMPEASRTVTEPKPEPIADNSLSAAQDMEFTSPLDNSGQRATKKEFGMFITPQNSPVQPERFRGYHTGADYEILPGEENMDVKVKAVCSGRLITKQVISGYGGVAVQECKINGEAATVLYGHISLKSVKWETGSEIAEAEIIGMLGDPAKGETDGERKHLHLGIRKGNKVDFRGYVNSESELAGWIDPCLYYCK